MACCFRYKLFGREEERDCQFASETDFITLGDGTTWCRFHLPMRDEAGNDSPKAGWDDGEVNEFNHAVFHIIDAAIDTKTGKGRTANLTGVVFPGVVNFRRYNKKRPFPRIHFHRSVFSDDAYFEEAVFSGYANFKEATFLRDAEFREAVFSGIVNFCESAFSGYAEFCEATFSENPDFSKAIFSGVSRFYKVAFSEGAVFRETIFSALAEFREAAFSGTTDFREAIFLKSADFSSEDVQSVTPSRSSLRIISFSSATFGGTADFNNRRFTNITRFRCSIFKQAPKFHNTVLHQDTDFDGADFRDVRSEDAERNYRTLKLAMETLRSRREEAMFFALEQRSLRYQSTTPWMNKIVSWLYDKAAEYGQNFLLPLLGMVFISAVFVDVYYGVLHYMPAPDCSIDFLGFTLKQVFRPFEVWSSRPGLIDPIAGCGDARMVLRSLATLQTLVTYALLTLFLLALRKRFRML